MPYRLAQSTAAHTAQGSVTFVRHALARSAPKIRYSQKWAVGFTTSTPGGSTWACRSFNHWKISEMMPSPSSRVSPVFDDMKKMNRAHNATKIQLMTAKRYVLLFSTGSTLAHRPGLVIPP